MSPRRRILPVFVPHEGCPHRCVFCDQKRISGSRSPVTPQEVKAALSAIPHGGGWELAFYGGSFTALPAARQEALLSAASEALADGRLASLRLSTRPDAVDAETLDRLRRYGVSTVELGCQSTDDGVLRLSGRGHTREDIMKASRLVREAGFSLILQMMTGLPGSDPDSDLQTARELAALRPDGVRIYPTVIVAGTELESLWRSGAYREHTVEDAVSLCARIVSIFQQAGIPVIRLGLNPTEELSAGAALAGAYHPALGELVRSRMLRNRAEELLSGVKPGSRLTLAVSPRNLSAMIGQHRCNAAYLRERFGLSSLRIVSDESAGEGILVH